MSSCVWVILKMFFHSDLDRVILKIVFHFGLDYARFAMYFNWVGHSKKIKFVVVGLFNT